MLQVSGRNLPVSVSVLICFFTFDFQSDSRAKMFHVSGCFCSVRFGVHETAILWNAQQDFVLHTT